MEKKYVMIADDEPEIRVALKEIIHAISDNIFILDAADGSDAIRKINLQKFALLVLDLNMPRYSGKSVLEGINALPKEFRPEKILVISGFSSRDEIQKEFGAQIDFIAKPFTRATVEPYFRQILQGESNTQELGAKNFDIKTVNSFITATISVLETMAKTASVKDSLYLRDPSATSGDISAILAIHSTTHKGSLAISFRKDCFLGIVNRMLDENYTQINSENSDAVAELCNQIFGVAKKEINANGNDLKPAIPSVVTGDNHKVQHKSSGPCVVVKFKTDIGYFTIETVMESIPTETGAISA